MRRSIRNRHAFTFFRRRLDFVSQRAATKEFEAYVVWGACIDALAAHYAANRNPTAKQHVRERFVDLLAKAVPALHLETIAIPIVAHELRFLVSWKHVNKALRRECWYQEYRQAANGSRVWRYDEDAKHYSNVARLLALGKDVEGAVASSRYADILYHDFRNPAVHNLDLGLKTCVEIENESPLDKPSYQPYIYKRGVFRPKRFRYRMRICFPLQYLCSVLSNVIDEMERQFKRNGWGFKPSYRLLR